MIRVAQRRFAPTVIGITRNGDRHQIGIVIAFVGMRIQDQIPELQVVIHGIEFELAILKADSPRPLLTRGVESIEVGLSERHVNVLGCRTTIRRQA